MSLSTATTNRRIVLASRPTTLPGPEHFRIEEERCHPPKDGEVLVEVKLAALSPWQGQRLKDFANYTRPFAIGELIDCDVLGTVVESRSTTFPVGARVTGRLGWQEYATVIPAGLERCEDDFEDTLALTALSSPGLTAYCAMTLFARPLPGQTLVVTSAAGSVGAYAVQLGKLGGARVVGICGTPAKRAMIRDELGADVALDYTAPDFEAALRDACPDGVHLFFDTTGGPVADSVFDNLAKYADVLIVGRTASNNSDSPHLDYVNMRQLWAREAAIQCFSRYSYAERWAFSRERMAALCREGKLRPLCHVTDGFENTPQALGDMLAGKHMGKALVRFS